MNTQFVPILGFKIRRNNAWNYLKNFLCNIWILLYNSTKELINVRIISCENKCLNIGYIAEVWLMEYVLQVKERYGFF